MKNKVVVFVLAILIMTGCSSSETAETLFYVGQYSLVRVDVDTGQDQWSIDEVAGLTEITVEMEAAVYEGYSNEKITFSNTFNLRTVDRKPGSDRTFVLDPKTGYIGDITMSDDELSMPVYRIRNKDRLLQLLKIE